MSSIAKVLERSIEKAIKNQWYESYWLVDMHGVITKPTNDEFDTDIHFYPYAHKVLQILTHRPDIRLILYTSSYPKQIFGYLENLEKYDIRFNYINENPEIRSDEDFGYYVDKPYFDIYLDDKAGFDPEEDWAELYAILCNQISPHPHWKNPKRRPMYNRVRSSTICKGQE